MGTLYSRSIGTLSAKGKYIFPLDCDDLFLDYNIFETIYNIAEKGNFDIVEFKAIFCIYSSKNILERKIKENYFSSHKLNLVLFQPELGDYFLKKGNQLGIYSIIDVYLWAKCIKTKIYQKALNLLGEQKYSRFMTLNEDLVGITILFNIAESFKFVGKYGILHVSTPGSVSWKGPGKKKLNLYDMYFIDIAIDFTINSFKNKKIIVYLIISLINQELFDETIKSDDNKNLFFSMLERILSCPYITKEDKDIIINKTSNIILVILLFLVLELLIVFYVKIYSKLNFCFIYIE